MISPQKWILKRPGIVIPVFFLSLTPVSGQIQWKEAAVAALGNSFVTRPGLCNASHNQAGLGWIDRNSLSLQHSRPFILKELGISSLCAQIHAGEGTFGTTLSTYGITGLRETSAWISYGMKLHPGITAGLGIHFWCSTIPEQLLYHIGFSFAAGIQAKVNDQLFIGAHVLHPAGWNAITPGMRLDRMVISAGFSYTFFQTVSYYSDLRILSENHIQSCHGIELKLSERIEFLLGMHNHPFSISWGVAFLLDNWTLHAAFEYLIDSGSTPFSSITYAW
ncbi:MAG: hypothetical protein ABFS38_17320 [Bacteroidota bacterium]